MKNWTKLLDDKNGHLPSGQKKGTQILVQVRTLVAALYCCQGFLRSSLLRKTNERILIVAAADEEWNGFPYQQ
jgi:hypothetical protein